jgi:ketosteroid isomerase-like protein
LPRRILATSEELRTKGAAMWHVREGKVTRLVINFDRDRADLGLGPEGDAV